MELDLRKQKLLAAVINHYVRTGEPIGSKALQNTDGLSVSSATIRNELSNLTALGLLAQPHTSAGRVPTQRGYRYYVDNLMDPVNLSERAKAYIEMSLSSASDAPEHILERAATLASELTELTALASTPPAENARVHRIRFVGIGRRTAMTVLISTTGMVKSRLFRCDFDITQGMLNLFDRALNEQAAGLPLESVNKVFAQTFAAQFGELGLLMPDMLMSLMDACREAAQISVYTSGATRLLYQDEINPVLTRGLLELLGNNSELEKLITNVSDDTTVSIGKENTSPYLAQSSLLTARYSIENKPAGVIAVLGPMRTDYAEAQAIIEEIARLTGELIGEIVRKE